MAAVTFPCRAPRGVFLGRSRPILVLLLLTLAAAATGLAAPPNILFIVVDDLNDWISPLGGHPQSATPNLDALAGQSVLFTRAYAAAPLCIPSRRALLSGQAQYNPYREGLQQAVTIPEAFSAGGWWSAGAGKIFHAQQHGSKWDEFKRVSTYVRKKSKAKGTAVPNVGNLKWGPAAIPRERMPDFKAASWVEEKLLDTNLEEPFFLGLGIYRPHLPWIVPEEYFQRFGRTDFIQLPEVFDQDVSDVPDAGRNLDGEPDRRKHHRRIEEAEKDEGAWKAGVQAYLASVNFADDLVGVALDALKEGKRDKNTVIVLLSDHGFHLGEKEHWRKRTLWEEATRVPLMIRVPPGTPGLPEGTSAGGAVCGRPVSLLDIYPTLLELAGLEPTVPLDGTSIVPLLRDPGRSWKPAIMSHMPGNYSVRSEDFRYTVYWEGSEELYDHSSDPSEWHNLANDANYAAVKKRMRDLVPVALGNPQWLPATGDPITHYTYPMAAIEASNLGPCRGWRVEQGHIPVHYGIGSAGYAFVGSCSDSNRNVLVYLHQTAVVPRARPWQLAMVAEIHSPTDAPSRRIEEAVQEALESSAAAAAMERVAEKSPPMIEYFADWDIFLTHAPTADEIGPVPSGTDLSSEFEVIQELAGVSGIRAGDCGSHTQAEAQPSPALQRLGALPVRASLFACSDSGALYGIGYRKGTDRHNFSVVHKVSPYRLAECATRDCEFYIQKLADDHGCRQLEIAPEPAGTDALDECDPFGPTAP